MYGTEHQSIVVESRLASGYSLLGKANGSLGVLFVLSKGRHTVAIIVSFELQGLTTHC